MQDVFEKGRPEEHKSQQRAEMAGKWILIALAAAASMLAMAEAATNHVVGGSGTGWTIPSSASLYSQWAAGQTFAVGDTLLFNFTTGLHNVIKVPKSSYDSCSPKNQIGSTITTGPATVTITAPGNHYYICGVSGHCSIGQKLAITVVGSSSSSPAPAPAPAASSPVPAPVPAPAASSPVPAPAPAPKASSPVPAPAPAPKAASPATSVSPSSAATPPGPAAGGPAPSSSAGTGGTPAFPSASSPSGNQPPTVAAGPSGGGPGTSSAPSSLLSSGYLTSFATAALLSATAAFLL